MRGDAGGAKILGHRCEPVTLFRSGEPRCQSAIRNPSARIDLDFACVNCDYNLRTLPTDGVCPECATPISDSLRPDLLRFADVWWLDQIRDGMGIALRTPLRFLCIFVVSRTAQSFLGYWVGAIVFPVLLIWFCVWMLSGLFKITTPDPPDRLGRDRELRVWCRRLGVASPLFFGAVILYEELSVRSILLGMYYVYLILILCVWLSGGAALFLVTLYLRRLARRGVVKGLIKMMTALVWGGVALNVIPLGAIIPLPVLSRLARAWGITAIAAIAYVIVALVWFRLVLAAERVLAVERQHRRRLNLCLTCAYDLTGNTSGRCPECGATAQKPMLHAA